jgi:hypothetical protein
MSFSKSRFLSQFLRSQVFVLSVIAMSVACKEGPPEGSDTESIEADRFGPQVDLASTALGDPVTLASDLRLGEGAAACQVPKNSKLRIVLPKSEIVVPEDSVYVRVLDVAGSQQQAATLCKQNFETTLKWSDWDLAVEQNVDAFALEGSAPIVKPIRKGSRQLILAALAEITVRNKSDNAKVKLVPKGRCWEKVGNALDRYREKNGLTKPYDPLSVREPTGPNGKSWARIAVKEDNKSPLRKYLGLCFAPEYSNKKVWASEVPAGSVLIYDAGACGFSPKHGHSEISLGKNSFASDFLSSPENKPRKCQPDWVFRSCL